MTTILVGGVGKADVASRLKELGEPDLEVTVTNDMDAAMTLRSGRADYFLGTCHTGAGGSLGVLVGLLGSGKCHTVGRGGGSAADFGAALDAGKVAFGFSTDQAETVVPRFVQALRERRG